MPFPPTYAEIAQYETAPIETRLMASFLDADRVFGGKKRGRVVFRQGIEHYFNVKYRNGKLIQFHDPLPKINDYFADH